MFRKAVHKNESGVALLFALGILSLLLVLGLAFASNALLAQKVARNNSNRSQAKLLAQSAISRIATAIMYYQFQAANWSPAIIPVDYSDIYSYGKDKDNKVFADGLFSKDDSLLTPPSSVSTEQPTTETFQKPKWAFIFDKPESKADRKIVGRIAYQQVPGSNGASKITMDSVLRGVYPQKSHATGGTPGTNHEPWKYRWGKTISELNFNTSTPLNNWNSYKPAESALTETTFSSIPAFFTAYGTTYFSGEYADEKKAFFERWFTGGTEPVEPEFYRYETVANGVTTEYKLYHRFNLGDIDKCDLKEDQWYDRFRNDTSVTLSQNSTAILDKLAGSSAEFKLTDELTPADTGIPFLKQIANEKETFSTLEARRKQIAANLNDYCDSDSKPTSDVDATNWSVEKKEGVTEPTFTGNERTPYIYELGYRLAIHQGDATKTAGIAAKADGNFSFQLNLYPAVKLAVIYEDIPTGFNSFSFRNSVRELSLKGKITGATYYGIKYEYDSEGKTLSDTVVAAELPLSGHTFEPPTFDYTWNSSSDQKLQVPAETDNSITFPTTPSLSGYPFKAADTTGNNCWSGSYDTTTTATPDKFKIDNAYLAEIVKAKTSRTPSKIVSGPTSITVNEVQIEAVAVKRGPLLLRGVYSDGKGGSSEFGVDYVRSTEKEENILKFNPTGSSLNLTQAEAFTFLLGGIQGMDPRQNLNEDDWHVSARATAGTSPWDAVMDVSTGPPVTGKANVSHGPDAPDHPFDPGAATDTGKYDQEKNVDSNGPAWTDTKHLSTAYIRNAPMQSLWELGVIHRGAAWQTLNLKAAGAPKDPSSPAAATSISPADMKQNLAWSNAEGTSYSSGDGGILEQVKLTENAYCYGKIDINMLCSDTSINKGYQSKYDDEMGQVLFNNIRYGQEISKFETDTATGSTLSFSSGLPLSQVVTAMTSSDKRPFASRTQFLDWTTGGNSLANAFGAATLTSASDAQLEEIVGKTINLLKAEPSASNVIQFIVVAQTIRDLSGTVARVRPDDAKVVTRNCAYGQFDVARYIDKDGSKITSDASGNISNDGSDNPSTPDSTQSPDDFIYFDEITGEVKMLVTLEKVSEVTGQLIVTSIEYID